MKKAVLQVEGLHTWNFGWQKSDILDCKNPAKNLLAERNQEFA
jgi:hypothetical protein